MSLPSSVNPAMDIFGQSVRKFVPYATQWAARRPKETNVCSKIRIQIEENVSAFTQKGSNDCRRESLNGEMERKKI
jgi:hypothetical protein